MVFCTSSFSHVSIQADRMRFRIFRHDVTVTSSATDIDQEFKVFPTQLRPHAHHKCEQFSNETPAHLLKIPDQQRKLRK